MAYSFTIRAEASYMCSLLQSCKCKPQGTHKRTQMKKWLNLTILKTQANSWYLYSWFLLLML